MKSEQINELAAALAKAQGSMKGAVKDASNPFFKKSYADLESIWDACRKALSENGLAVIQTTEVLGETLSLITTLVHSSGQSISGSYPIKPVKDDPQGIGSAITYARRYALASIVGVHQTDDDGNAASGKTHVPAPKAETKRPASPGDYVIDFGKLKGKPLKECAKSDLDGAFEWAVKNNAKPLFQDCYLGWKQIVETGEIN